MKKMLLILNPRAGMRRANRYLTEIVEIFNRADYTVEVYITEKQGDCAWAAQQRAGEFDLVVCAGGDGTFNEAVSGVLQSGADVPIGYIPCGSTNDFGNSLGLSTDVKKAAQDIARGSIHRCDVGRFGERYFTYVASFGAFTRASFATPQNVKNALGHTAYLLEGIQELSQIRTTHVKIELEGRVIEDDFLFGAISNSTSVGGILTLDPKRVDMGDGRFELLLVRAPRDLAELHECVLALQRQTYNCAMITFVSAPKLRITADPTMTWTLDGEREEGHETVTVENIYQAMKLMK